MNINIVACYACALKSGAFASFERFCHLKGGGCNWGLQTGRAGGERKGVEKLLDLARRIQRAMREAANKLV